MIHANPFAQYMYVVTKIGWYQKVSGGIGLPGLVEVRVSGPGTWVIKKIGWYQNPHVKLQILGLITILRGEKGVEFNRMGLMGSLSIDKSE